MSVLVDTNVLLRQTQPNHEQNGAAVESVARLLAGMNVHGVGRFLTFNDADFRRYAEIEVLHPTSV